MDTIAIRVRANGRARKLVCAALFVSAAGGCYADACKPSDFPIVLGDDAGDHSWVRQVVPILLGRKVKGQAEEKLLADLVVLTDRPTVLAALMAQPEFNEHWSETLVNSLRVDREGFTSQSDCYGPPLRAGAPAAPLAGHIISNPTSAAAPGGAFNMSDVVRSAVALDNLAPLARANLFALVHHPHFNTSEQQVRDDFGTTFGEVYLDRRLACMQCHNSDGSTTDQSSGWNRFSPIAGSFEQALYGSSHGGDPLNVHEMFRTDQQAPEGTAGYAAPWGMSGCGAYMADMGASSGGSPYFTGPLPAGATVTTLADKFKEGYDALALHNLHRTIPAALQAACHTCQTSCTGATPLDPEAVVNGTFVRDLVTGTGAPPPDCKKCHGASGGLSFPTTLPEHWYSHLINVPSSEAPAQTRVIPGNSADSVLVKKLLGTFVLGQMPADGPPYVASADIDKVKAWIDALPSASTCSNCSSLNCDPTVVEGREAFAYLAAARIVNIVWQEAMGYPLTIANYFPRNANQRGALWNLTEFHFVPAHWSLQALLTRILTANTFNRHAPDVQSGTASAYREPEIFNPWVLPDPRVPPANQPGWTAAAHLDLYFNAMTDGIYRYPAWNLLRSVQKALDWPGPKRFPDASYPDATLERDIGQYLSPSAPGFTTTNFGALLSWENRHGLCANHRIDANPDWIDRLASAAAAFTPPPASAPLTLRDLVAVERDWLLADGALSTTPLGLPAQTEEQALAGIAGSLDATVASLGTNLTGKLRSVCGMLIETPQFFLAGVAPSGPGIVPRLRVCNGAPCTYLEICQALAPSVSLPGPRRLLICSADSVDALGLVDPHQVGRAIEQFCPACPIISLNPEECFKGEGFCRVTPPACDPRCSRIDCCGGPGLASRLDPSGTIITWAEGATVVEAEGVRVRRAGSKRLEGLSPKDRLGYGDLIELPPSATLVLDNAGTQMKYDGKRLKAALELKPRYFLVTGPKALETTKVPRSRPITKELLDWMRTSPKGWRTNPDGSTPIVITDEMRGPGALEREWQKKRENQKPR